MENTVNIAALTEIPYLLIAVKLLCAVCAGGAIGLERALHGRPAGIRTLSIVCLASAALVQVTLHAAIWIAGAPPETLEVDGSRLIRVIVSGIAFLGAGAIFREGLTIRGLTTAAAIWATAIIGVMFGTGLFYIGTLMTVIIIIILSLFQKTVEVWLRSRNYARCNVTFPREGVIKKDNLMGLLAEHKMETVGNINLQIINGGEDCEMSMTIRSDVPGAFSRLSKALRENTEYKTFSIKFTQN